MNEQKITSFKFVLVNESGRRIGQDHHRAKLSDADVDLIFALREYGLSYSVIAGKFDDIEGGISKETVRDVLKGRRRGQVPFATKKVLVRASALLWLPALADEFDSAFLGAHMPSINL